MDKGLLERCEAEALHLSGAIQPHGTLLVVGADGTASHVAENVAAFLDRPPADWLGRPLPEALARLVADLGEAPGSRRFFDGEAEGGAGLLDVVASRGAGGEIVLEFSVHAPGGEWRRPAGVHWPDPPADADALAAARQRLVEEIAALTGFQRVMFYAFREDGDGEVVAEAHEPQSYGSYLGLRFPASDIPQIARALYMKNPWRMIPDAAVDPVPVLGRTAAPPDLTWSDLRSVSPVHRVYLANMGVAASLSFPVVAHGALAALVAAHHRTPRRLPTAALEQASSLVRAHAFALAGYQSQRRMRLVDGMAHRFAAFRDMLHRHGDLRSAWPELGAWLIREFRADGAMLCADAGCLAAVGDVFEPAALEAMETWFRETQRDFVWSGDSLSRQLPCYPLSAVAGALAVRVGRQGVEGRFRVYLTRLEHVHEVAWGGNPEKPVELHDGELGIAPRRSFEKWIEKRLGYSRAWDNETRLLALKLRELLQREAEFGRI